MFVKSGACELMKEYHRIGQKRPCDSSIDESSESKKRLLNDQSDYFAEKICAMFPDADSLFLINECQNLQSWEECLQFINSVMNCGLYPKKSGFEIQTAEASSSSSSCKNSSAPECSKMVENALGKASTSKIADHRSTETCELVPEMEKVLRSESLDGSPETSKDTIQSTHPVQKTPKKRATRSKGKSKNNEAKSDGAGPSAPPRLDPKEQRLQEQIADLVRIFPHTDPSYLRSECIRMRGCPKSINAFVFTKIEKNDMPTREDYEKRKEVEALQSRYTKNFSIEDFLKAIPDPWSHFLGEKRSGSTYQSHSSCYLKAAFRRHHAKTISQALASNNYNLYKTYTLLKKDLKKQRVTERSEYECYHNLPTTVDIQFLQEVAFIENEVKIKGFIETQKKSKLKKMEKAKRTGSLLVCRCCYDDEVLPEDIVRCPNKHAFCKDCVVRSVEVAMGDSKWQFSCLVECDKNFQLSSLQDVLKPDVFSRVMQAIQLEEIKAAGIDDLVQCPFCHYATVMPPENRVMTCLNPKCLKESCRLCQELNHVPLRCEEVEKSEEVKMRTYIEDKMTEALVRTCYKCSRKFVKEDGCNKMSCACGAKMCYICREPVADYAHFNMLGGTDYHKCPLYSTNDELHVEAVKKMGEEAKAEVLQANPGRKLMHDPTILLPEPTGDRQSFGAQDIGADLEAGLRAAYLVALNELQVLMQQLAAAQQRLPIDFVPYQHRNRHRHERHHYNLRRRHRRRRHRH